MTAALVALTMLIPVTADNPDALDRALYTAATAAATAVRLDPPVAVDSGTPPIQAGQRPASEWHDTALAAGWPTNLWYFVACTMARESGGDPYALNTKPPDYSLGLMQMNTRGRLWAWFVDKGLTDRNQLFDPYTNLHIAWLMFQERDAQPWSYSCR